MKAVTFHVTDLDAWRWFKELDSVSTDDMVLKLLRTLPPKPQMLAGTAWHKVIENPPDVIDAVVSNGVKFTVGCESSITLPMIREIRAEKAYDIHGVAVTLTGGCDGITGNKITDHKLSFNPNPERYFDSAQWRAYLDIYNADVFEYIIYHAIDQEEDFKNIYIRDISIISMYRYQGMVEDIKSDISELLYFVESHVPQLIKEAA